MPHFVRVEDRETGDQYDVDARAFRESVHTKVNSPKQWPDLTGPGARPRPALHRTDKAGRAAPRASGRSNSTTSTTTTPEAGQPAKKEN